MTMAADQAVELLRVGLGLLALWVLYFVVWSDYKLDAFRQRLFDLRAELFEYAASSGLPFDDPTYGLLRDRINRMIRWAHQFTPMHFILLALTIRTSEPTPRPHAEWLHA